MTFADIRADFELLDDWEDRYRYLIELGRNLPPLEPNLKTDANKVRPPVLHFDGDSDAHIVRGLVALLFALYQDQPPADILAVDAAKELAELGLKDHLSPQRSNGLSSMVERIKVDVRAALVATGGTELRQ
jgi:cysteine desulfuration protein SufE